MKRSRQEPGPQAARSPRGPWRRLVQRRLVQRRLGWRWRRRSPSRSRGRSAPVLVTLALAVLVGGGCELGRDGQDGEGLTPGRFVEVVAALREAERAVAWDDSAASLFAERKAEILEREGVTEAELRGFVAARDVSELEVLWDAIARRLRYVPDDQGEPFPPGPGDDVRDEARGEVRGQVEGDPGSEPDARPQPDTMRRRPPPLPSLPVPPDTGERRLH